MFKTIIKLLKGKHHAGSNENAENVGQQHVCSGIHRFASKREQAISDCCRVRLLAKALQDQRSRASDCSPGDQVRELTEIAKAAGLWIDYNQVAALGDLVSKRTGAELEAHQRLPIRFEAHGIPTVRASCGKAW